METCKREGRVCACGCGRTLVKKDGAPDFTKRRFFDAECRKRDDIRRVTEQRILRDQHVSRFDKLKLEVAQHKPIFVKVSSADDPILVPDARAAIALAKKYPKLIEEMTILEVRKRKTDGGL